MIPKIKLVTFDAFNTILKLNASVGTIYASATKNLFPELSANFPHVAEKIDKQFPKVYKTHYKRYPNFGLGQITSEQFWHGIVRETIRDTGLELDSTSMNILTSSLYKDFSTRKHWHVFEDVKEILDRCKKANIKVGIVSNFDERLETILTNLDLRNDFDFVTCSYQCGYAKPDLGIFEIVLKKANATAEECIHIGDNLELDFHAPKKLGIHAYVIDRFETFKNDNLCFRLKSLKDLPIPY